MLTNIIMFFQQPNLQKKVINDRKGSIDLSMGFRDFTPGSPAINLFPADFFLPHDPP